MYIENGERYFESRREQVEYQLTKNFIMSFYRTKADYSRLLNNINYVKNSNEEKSFECFKKEMNVVLHLMMLECPQMKDTVKKYNKNKDTFIPFVLVEVYNHMVKNMRQIGLLKVA